MGACTTRKTMGSLRVVLIAALLLARGLGTTAWFALSPVENGVISLFDINDDRSKGKEVVSIKASADEDVELNNLACGRCFCLVLTHSRAARLSFLYNVSFCLVPTPGVESRLALPYTTHGIHSNLGEGDGGDGFSVSQRGSTWNVVSIVGNQTIDIVDISTHVNGAGTAGTVAPGGTAHCAATQTMWVAVNNVGTPTATLLTVDLKSRMVTSITTNTPQLAGHFANCKTETVGGIRLVHDNAGNVVEIGEVSPTGKFNVVDSVALSVGSRLEPTAVLDALETPGPGWLFQGFRAVLSDLSSARADPGMLVTSEGSMGSAKLFPLKFFVTGLSVSY